MRNVLQNASLLQNAAEQGPTASVVRSGCRCNLGSFSNGDSSENVTIVMNSRFSKRRRDYSNSVFKCQTKVKFTGVEFLETRHPTLQRERKNKSSCVYVLHKISHQETSRPSRVVTAKNCTKKYKCTYRLVALVIKPFAFLKFSVPSPSSLLKLPNMTEIPRQQ